MTEITRRDAIKLGTAAALAAGASGLVRGSDARAEAVFAPKPEAGASLKVLRWKRFVQGDEDVWAANTKKYSDMSGVPVRVDAENWEDIRPKAAVAANIGSGPDIIITTNDDAHKFPNKLLDVSDLAEYLDRKSVV